MSALSHRDRVLTVLSHEIPDRLPMDLGGCPASGINLYAYKRLKEHLGLPGPVRVQAERSLLAWPDDAVLERFDADLRLIVAYTAEDSGTRGCSTRPPTSGRSSTPTCGELCGDGRPMATTT